MESITKSKLALFAENTQIIRKEFKWHNSMTKRLSALIYSQANKKIDCGVIEQCLKMMKQNTGLFSSFRGNMSLCIASLLSLSDNPQKLFDKTLKVYDMLKLQKLRSSDYLAVAAFQIAANCEPIEYQATVDRTRNFYDGMKSHNFFITGQDDYIFAAMLGLSDLDIASGTERIAEIINRLKGEFWNKNSVQTLSQILALGKSCDETVNHVLFLKDAFRKQGIKLDKDYTLPTLGVLALLPVEASIIVSEIAEAQQTLRMQKGFSSWSVSKQELLIYTAAAIIYEHSDSADDNITTATLSTTLTNIIIAQQVAMIAVVVATTTAASSASS